MANALPEDRLSLLRTITDGEYTTPTCPLCDVKMGRRSMENGELWGCPNCKNHPSCRQTFKLRNEVEALITGKAWCAQWRLARFHLGCMPARPFTPSEISLLESRLLAQGRLRDRMLLIAGTNVGYRITELLTWTVGQVLTREGDVTREVTVTRALLKGGSGAHKRSVRCRRVVLNERARGAIRDYLASLGRVPAYDEFLFQSREGANRPVHRTQAHRILKRLCRTCGIDAARVSTHSLRKTFVRAVYDASQHDLIRTQRIVGHSSPVVTARYLESTQSELDELVLGLPQAAPAPAAPQPQLALAS